jgi:hypothetical protein
MLSRFFRPSRVALAGLALCGGLCGVTLAATAGTAYAGGGPVTIVSSFSGLNLDVENESTAPGAPVIQWWPNYQANQAWNVPPVDTPGVIRNLNSGMCLTTDGTPGHQLFQEPCLPQLAQYETWAMLDDGVVWEPYQGLWLDVYNDSTQAGDPIDAWNYNGQSNQMFYYNI